MSSASEADGCIRRAGPCGTIWCDWVFSLGADPGGVGGGVGCDTRSWMLGFRKFEAETRAQESASWAQKVGHTGLIHTHLYWLSLSDQQHTSEGVT